MNTLNQQKKSYIERHLSFPIYDLAQDLGLTTKVISDYIKTLNKGRYINKYDSNTKRQGSYINNIATKEFILQHQSSMTWKQMAFHVNLTYNQLRYFITKHQLLKPNRHRYTVQEIAYIKFNREKQTVRQIAKHLNIPYRSIINALQRYK